MYQGCIKQMKDPEMVKYRTIDGESFRIGKDAITFYYGRCSNHAMQALDEVGEFANVLEDVRAERLECQKYVGA